MTKRERELLEAVFQEIEILAKTGDKEFRRFDIRDEVKKGLKIIRIK